MPLFGHYLEHSRSVVEHLTLASTHPSLWTLWDLLDKGKRSSNGRSPLESASVSFVEALLCGVPFYFAFAFTSPFLVILTIVDCLKVILYMCYHIFYLLYILTQTVWAIRDGNLEEACVWIW